jgi:hypothetical protein
MLFRFLGSEICFKGHFGHEGGLDGRREIEKREIKTRKPMYVLGSTLVQIHALVSVFLFLSS